VTFNNTAPRTRNILTKRSTHLELEQKWRVAVVVRGRYYPPGGGFVRRACLEALLAGQRQPGMCTLPSHVQLAQHRSPCRLRATHIARLTAGQKATSNTDDERPLFLRITPGRTLPPDPQWRQHACDMCAADVTAIIRGAPRPMPQPIQAAEGTTGAPPPGAPGALPPPGAPVPPPPGMPPAPAAAPPPPQPPSYPKSGPGWVCLYPGCDGAPEFDAPARLRGPGDSYLAHILAATGCAAKVLGKGSGAPPPPAGELEPPLHLRLEHNDGAKLEEGRRLAGNLIDTIRDDYSKAHPSAPPPPPAGQYDPPAPPPPPAAPWQHAPSPPGAPALGAAYPPPPGQPGQAAAAYYPPPPGGAAPPAAAPLGYYPPPPGSAPAPPPPGQPGQAGAYPPPPGQQPGPPGQHGQQPPSPGAYPLPPGPQQQPPPPAGGPPGAYAPPPPYGQQPYPPPQV
jgi:hypothetical protein